MIDVEKKDGEDENVLKLVHLQKYILQQDRLHISR